MSVDKDFRAISLEADQPTLDYQQTDVFVYDEPIISHQINPINATSSSSTFAVDSRRVDRREKWPNVGALLKRKLRTCCSRQLLSNRLPIIGFVKNYKIGNLYLDFIAGVTVGLTAIPQGIAYAVVAGLEPQYGLYSELLASFVYCVFGSCHNVTIGPTAIMALMVQRYVTMNADFAVFAAFMNGIIVLALGLLNMGFLVQFISIPVTAGFTTAAAMQIGSVQVKSLLGIPGSASEFLDAWILVFNRIDETKLWDTLLGVITVVFLIALKMIGDVRQSRFAPAFKYISLTRNALAVLIGSVLAFLLTREGQPPPFALTGRIEAGFPPFGPPPLSTVVGNETLGIGDMMATMGSSLVAIPFVAILEIIVVAKAFSNGRSIDATQELIALGCCNIFGSFVRAMPVTGSFTRTAVNNASGVRTPFGGILTGVMVMLAIGFLTGTFQYIPKATLAAVIITAMVYMVEFDTGLVIWRSRRLDIIPFAATVIACLTLGLDYGILVGIAFNLAFVFYESSRPNTNVTHLSTASNDVLLIEPDQSLVFSSAEYFQKKVLQHLSTEILSDPLPIIVIKGEHVRTIDWTVAKVLQQMVRQLHDRGHLIVFWNWYRQPVDIMWRLSKDLGALCHDAESLDELLDHAGGMGQLARGV